MMLTPRDIRLLRDCALSHVLSRDQLIALGYFSSVSRANTRTRELRKAKLLRVLETPFFAQRLYCVDRRAHEVLGNRIAPLVAGRSASPRFLQHALTVTNTRIALAEKGLSTWRFEQQLRASFRYAGRDFEVRPDGLAEGVGELVAIEADLGHVAPAKFREKLRAYDAFVTSGACVDAWHVPTFTLLVLTTGALRASKLKRLVPTPCSFALYCHTFKEFGVQAPELKPPRFLPCRAFQSGTLSSQTNPITRSIDHA
jgi:hypothetical protein